MAERKTEHLRYRYGICLNDNCPKCKSKEVQEIPVRKDFVCAECGKPLRECPPPKKKTNGKLIGIIAAAVVLLGGICWGVSSKMHTETTEPDPQVTQENVSVDVEEQTESAAPEVVKPETPKPTTTPAKPKGPSVPWGKYTGPENGRGGEILVTKAYSLVINKIEGTTLELQPGNTIEETKFVDGELRQGVWVHDGIRQFFTR